MANDLTSILYDHYKDSCAITGAAIKRRDRLMLFVIAVIGFFTFQTIFPSASNQAVNDFLNFKFGLTLQLNLSVIGNIVWFLLLTTTIRYFQVAVFVERQHKYVHAAEEKLNKHLETELITREGKHYLTDYPKFSNWMWMLYAIIFPSLLLLVSTIKIFNEWVAVSNLLPTGLLIDSAIFLLLAISIILYLAMIHFGCKKTKSKIDADV